MYSTTTMIENLLGLPNQSRWIRLLLVLAGLGLAWPAWPGEIAQPGILFLHVRVKDGAVSLVKSRIRPGKLKPARDAGQRGGIEYELLSVDSQRLFRGRINDPAVQRLEYPDALSPGQIRMKVVERREAEITIRLPNNVAARRIQFYRITPPGDRPARQDSRRQLIGSIDLPTPSESRP